MKNFTLRKMAIVAIALFTMSISAICQEKGDVGIGVNLITGTGGNLTNFGIGGRLLYTLNDPFRLEGAYHYFFEKDHLTSWTAALKGHYLIPFTEKITVYPMVGLGVMGVALNIGSFKVSNSEFGGILGGGVDIKLNEKVSFNIEPNIWIFTGKDEDTDDDSYRLMLSAGIIFKL